MSNQVTKAQIQAAVELAEANPDQWTLMSALVAPKIREAVAYELEVKRLAKAGEKILDACVLDEYRGETFEADLEEFTANLAAIAVSAEKVLKAEEKGERGRGSKRYLHRQAALIPVAGGEVTVILRKPLA